MPNTIRPPQVSRAIRPGRPTRLAARQGRAGGEGAGRRGSVLDQARRLLVRVLDRLATWLLGPEGPCVLCRRWTRGPVCEVCRRLRGDG